MIRRKMGVFASLLAALLFMAAQGYAVTYSVTYLPPFQPTAMNANGDIVGYGVMDSTKQTYPVLYSQGKLISLGSFGGVHLNDRGNALAINDSGQIVGYSYAPDGNPHAFLYSNGQMSDLGAMGSLGSEADAISDSGQIAGTFEGADVISHAFLGIPGNFTDLGNLGTSCNGPYLKVTGMNARGDIIGTTPPPSRGGSGSWVYSSATGNLAYLPSLAGSVGAGPRAINSSGQIVGTLVLADGHTQHPFLYSNGVMTDLDPTAVASLAYDINDKGQIVGISSNYFAFLYENGQIVDLNSLVDKKFHVSLNGAYCINNAGQIVSDDVIYGGGVLLTPVPEPSSLILLAMISLGFAGYWAKRRVPRASCQCFVDL